MVNAIQTHEVHDESLTDRQHFKQAAAALLAKTRTIAAASYKSHVGQPIAYPRYDLPYVDNFLHMMFSVPYRDYVATPEVAHALNMFLVLHADHEQNCSTSTVRMVGSSQANMFASVSGGINALWGPLHGGANMGVIEMLEEIKAAGMKPQDYINRVKNKSSGVKLMGFGHRVYRNFDPRAKILKAAADKLLDAMHVTDPLLDIARGGAGGVGRRTTSPPQAVPERRLLLRHHPARDRHPARHVHRAVRDRAHARLDRALEGSGRQSGAAHLPAAPDLRRAAARGVGAAGRALRPVA